MAIKRRRRRKKIRTGLILSWAGALIALGLAGFALNTLMQTRARLAAIDPQTLCDGMAPTRVHAILLDSSDPLTDVQRVRTEDYLHELIKTFKAGARVDVYMATAKEGHLAKPLFSKCQPQTGQDTAGLTSNPARLRAKWKAEFMTPLNAAISSGLRQSGRGNSPILETISAVAAQSFGLRGSKTDGARGRDDLIIVSDFIQNSPLLNQYARYSDVDSFVASGNSVAVAMDLRNVHVEMIYVQRKRQKKRQTEAHRNWWSDFFRTQGAVSVRAFIV